MIKWKLFDKVNVWQTIEFTNMRTQFGNDVQTDGSMN